MVTLACMAAAALATALYFLLTQRRRTLNFDLDLDSMPPIEQALSTLAGLTSATVHRGNAARVFQNGAFFAAVEMDVLAARKSVHFETFVWRAGELERRFVDLLCRKAGEGVTVRMVIDAVGGYHASPEQTRRLRAAGVDLQVYCKPRWWNLRRMNHRTHRKLLIIDGQIGYACGHGIADEWLGDAQDADHVRDTGVRLEGPVVGALQSAFMNDWMEESKRIIAGEDCFPELPEKGAADAHVVTSGFADTVSSVALLYTVAIACARSEVIIQNPYFVPDRGVVRLLKRVVERGVAVHLMVPGKHTDSRFVQRASCHLYEELLEAGVQLYEFMPTLLHQKIVIVDGQWSHIGSTNFDERSLALNKEVGVGLLDAGVAAQLRAAFEHDLRRSRPIRLERWRRRGSARRFGDWLAYRVHAQL